MLSLFFHSKGLLQRKQVWETASRRYCEGGASGAYCVVLRIHATFLAVGNCLAARCAIISASLVQELPGKDVTEFTSPTLHMGLVAWAALTICAYAISLAYPTAGVNALAPITSIMIKVQPLVVSRVAEITAINNIINQIILNAKNCEVHNNFTGFTPIGPPHCKHPFYLKYLHHLPCQA